MNNPPGADQFLAQYRAISEWPLDSSDGVLIFAWDSWRIQQFNHPTGFPYLSPSHPISLPGLQGGLGSASLGHSGSRLHGRLRILFWWSLSAIQEVSKEDRVEIHGSGSGCTCFPSASSLKQETSPWDTDPGKVMAEHLGRLSHHTVARRGSSVAVQWQSLAEMQGRAGKSLHVCCSQSSPLWSALNW